MSVTVFTSELSPLRTVLEIAEEGWRNRPSMIALLCHSVGLQAFEIKMQKDGRCCKE